MLDLGLMQRQGSYASGTVFQAVLVDGGVRRSSNSGLRGVCGVRCDVT